jgi:hypothetical protein
MKDYILLGVTPDELELPTVLFEDYNQMANALKITMQNCRVKVCSKAIDSKLNLRFVKVHLKKERKK